MIDKTPCPSCGKMITEEDVVQDVPWDDCFAYGEVYFHCPFCETLLKVHADITWSFSISEKGMI